MKTKAEKLGTLPERLAKLGVDIEDVEEIHFEDGKEVIYGKEWILDGQVMLKKPDLSDPKIREKVQKKAKELSSVARKRLGKE